MLAAGTVRDKRLRFWCPSGVKVAAQLEIEFAFVVWPPSLFKITSAVVLKRPKFLTICIVSVPRPGSRSIVNCRKWRLVTQTCCQLVARTLPLQSLEWLVFRHPDSIVIWLTCDFDTDLSPWVATCSKLSANKHGFWLHDTKAQTYMKYKGLTPYRPFVLLSSSFHSHLPFSFLVFLCFASLYFLTLFLAEAPQAVCAY